VDGRVRSGVPGDDPDVDVIQRGELAQPGFLRGDRLRTTDLSCEAAGAEHRRQPQRGRAPRQHLLPLLPKLDHAVGFLRASLASASVVAMSAPYSQHSARTSATFTGALPVSIFHSFVREARLASSTSRSVFAAALRSRRRRTPNWRRTTVEPGVGMTTSRVFHGATAPE